MGITRLEFQIDATGNCILCKSRRSTTVNRNLPYRIQHELTQIVLLVELQQPDHNQQQPHDEHTTTSTTTTTRRITFDEFCDQIDEALLPLEDLKRKNVRTSCILMGLAFALIASHHTIQALRNNNSENENENTNESSSFMSSRFGNLPNIILSLLFIIIPFIGICYISRTTQKGESKIFSKISDMCDEISVNSEQVKFTLRYRSDEKHSRIVKYIEVKMLNSSAEQYLLEEGQGQGRRRMMMGPSRPGTPETVISYESSLSEDD